MLVNQGVAEKSSSSGGLGEPQGAGEGCSLGAVCPGKAFSGQQIAAVSEGREEERLVARPLE